MQYSIDTVCIVAHRSHYKVIEVCLLAQQMTWNQVLLYVEVSSYDFWCWSSEAGTIFAILQVQNITEGILEEADLLA